MLKPASSNCNLACEYCFYHSLSSKRNDFSKGFMSENTARKVIDSALDFAKGTDVFFHFRAVSRFCVHLIFIKILFHTQKA